VRKEAADNPIAEPGLLLLPPAKLRARITARLTAAGIPADDQPKPKQIRRWQVRRIKAMANSEK
jgi:hypothetical protein